MKHTIQKLKNLMIIVEDKKTIIMDGYAFIDECGSCIIIVYGEGRRDSMSKYLTDDGDMIHIKYHCFKLLP